MTECRKGKEGRRQMGEKVNKGEGRLRGLGKGVEGGWMEAVRRRGGGGLVMGVGRES